MKPAKGNRQLARERLQLTRRFETPVKQKRRRTPAGEMVTTITTLNLDVEIVASEHFSGDDSDKSESWI